MPRLTVHAADILKRAEGSFDARVRQAADAKLDRIERVSTFIVERFATGLDEHFVKQEQARATPYPDKNTLDQACAEIVVTELGELARDIDVAFARDDERTAVHARVIAALGAAGYESEGVFHGAGMLSMFIRDPEFKP